ncbi:hypothetical protein [Lyngbya sp. CCY1209]|uniref:hypothetical protein n=1 Tax=Lyngbya sp. CCY1209 TaxID=2886103 RepID=UPI002D212947|nr:hypothetical protein [Lyngbya sp. CCY1209]MEB3883622.1 hypothetical protein [Lyngbya sp. CCY1209]
MKTDTITVRVDAETAKAYESSSEIERRKIDLLLNLKLKQMVKPSRPLEEVIREISQNAQNRGLTPEMLESILGEL